MFFPTVFPLSVYILQMETHKFMEGASLGTMVKFTTRIRFGFVLPILPVYSFVCLRYIGIGYWEKRKKSQSVQNGH